MTPLNKVLTSSYDCICSIIDEHKDLIEMAVLSIKNDEFVGSTQKIYVFGEYNVLIDYSTHDGKFVLQVYKDAGTEFLVLYHPGVVKKNKISDVHYTCGSGIITFHDNAGAMTPYDVLTLTEENHFQLSLLHDIMPFDDITTAIGFLNKFKKYNGAVNIYTRPDVDCEAIAGVISELAHQLKGNGNVEPTYHIGPI